MNQFDDGHLDDEFEGITLEKLQSLKRSQLQKRDIHEWLKKRYMLTKLGTMKK